jgi:hypothetical protein
MKMTKTALIASAMLILSSQVFAGDTHQATRVVQTADMSSKAAAYELALDKLQTLQADSSIELNNDLGHVTPDPRSLSLNDRAYITVAEKMNASGEIHYTGLVNVNVTYDSLD